MNMVWHQDGTEDFLIEGLLDRNRALNGDVVVCKMLAVQTGNSCGNIIAQSLTSQSAKPSQQSTPKKVIAESKMKENILKITVDDSVDSPSPDIRVPENVIPKAHKKKKKKLAKEVSNENHDVCTDVQSKSLGTPLPVTPELGKVANLAILIKQ